MKNRIQLKFSTIFGIVLLGVCLTTILSNGVFAQNTLDPTFNGRVTESYNSVFSTAIQTDGKILVGGLFTKVNGVDRRYLERFNADGTRDLSFNVGNLGFNSSVYEVTLQPDGKILVGGAFFQYNGANVSRNIARLNSDGSLDTSFNSGGTGANGITLKIVVQPDGKILFGGLFTQYNGTARARIARLNADGTLDINFDPVTGANSTVEEIAVQSDGKVIIGGFFSTFNGIARNAFARLNADGTRDTSFQTEMGANGAIRDLAVQADGKIVIGGEFTDFGGISRNRVARLNSDGTLDASFDVGTGANSVIVTVAILSNGKIFVGGFFSTFNGIAGPALARLNADGSLDTSFVSGVQGGIQKVIQLLDGKVLIGGSITSYSGIPRSGLARLFTPIKTPFDFDGDGKADVSVFRPSNGAWYLQQSQNGFTGIQFGISTDKIVPADYDGDGKTDVAVYRSGVWYLQRSQLGFTGVAFGTAEDIPVPADYDGDGKADIAVFRPSNGTWYLQRSSLGFTGIQFGQNGDKPVAADYDGDGKTDVAVYRAGTWYLQRSLLGFTGIAFGLSDDKPVSADYDGDGKADVAVFRPSNGTWYLQRSQAGFTGVQFGISTDAPTPADYDGDGKADVAVFRNGTWYLQRSQAGFTGVAFGSAGDQAVPNAFVP